MNIHIFNIQVLIAGLNKGQFNQNFVKKNKFFDCLWQAIRKALPRRTTTPHGSASAPWADTIRELSTIYHGLILQVQLRSEFRTFKYRKHRNSRLLMSRLFHVQNSDGLNHLKPDKITRSFYGTCLLPHNKEWAFHRPPHSKCCC